MVKLLVHHSNQVIKRSRAAMAATFYFSKSRQNNGLAGLTSRGGPKVHIVGGPHGPINETHC